MENSLDPFSFPMSPPGVTVTSPLIYLGVMPRGIQIPVFKNYLKYKFVNRALIYHHQPEQAVRNFLSPTH